MKKECSDWQFKFELSGAEWFATDATKDFFEQLAEHKNALLWKRIEAAQTVLEFYASYDNYRGSITDVQKDNGELARALLDMF